MKTVEEIYREMMDRFSQETGMEPNGTGEMAVRMYALAAQVYGLYEELAWTCRQCFPQTATGEELEKHGFLRGIARNPARQASGTLRFSVQEAVEEDLEIAQGTVCMTAGLVAFETTQAGVLPAGELSVDLPAQAVEPGPGGNVSAGTVRTMAVAPVGAVRRVVEFALTQMDAGEALPAQEAPAEEKAQPEPVKTEIRDIYEVFLDSVCLEDNLLSYLIDILKRGAKDEFQTLSHAAARTLLDMDEFLLWLGNKEAFAGPDERACAAIMDGCLNRLMQEGQRELAAALLSGDETTFKLFRTQAPELVHLPDATYEWYAQNYLDRYYPVRFILRMNGVVFPELTQKEE